MTTRTQSDKNYYSILGLDPAAGAEEIRRAYRRLALDWHPDRNPHNPASTERFQEISEAYAVLIDPQKRSRYDQARHTGKTYQAPQDREDLFRDMFSNPLSSSVFEELAREFERMGMRVDRHYFQSTLFGGRAFVMGGVFVVSPLTPLIGLYRLARAALEGGAPSASPRILSAPASVFSGLLKLGRRLLELPAALVTQPPEPRQSDLVLPLQLAPGEAAHGTNKTIVIDAGAGREEFVVRIPAGVRPGNRLRLRGKGRQGTGGARGDLYLELH